MRKYTTIISMIFFTIQSISYSAKKSDHDALRKELDQQAITSEKISETMSDNVNAFAKLYKNVKGIFKGFDDDDEDNAKKESQSCDVKLQNAINDTNNKLQNILNTRWNSMYDMQSAVARVQNDLNTSSNIQQVSNTQRNNNTNNKQNSRTINTASPKVKIINQKSAPKNNVIKKIFRNKR